MSFDTDFDPLVRNIHEYRCCCKCGCKKEPLILYDFCDECSPYNDSRSTEEELESHINQPKIGERKGFSDKVREQVMKDQNHKCKICSRSIGELKSGKLVWYDLDHIDDDHSNNDISNCQALCTNCHAHKTRRH